MILAFREATDKQVASLLPAKELMLAEAIQLSVLPLASVHIPVTDHFISDIVRQRANARVFAIDQFTLVHSSAVSHLNCTLTIELSILKSAFLTRLIYPRRLPV